MRELLEGADYFFWRTIARILIDQEQITAVYTGIVGSTLNPVVRSNFKEDKALEIINQVKVFYKKNKTRWCWCLGSGDAPKNLPFYLEQSDLRLAEKVPRMGIRLDEMSICNSDYDVREVLTRGEFKKWSIPIRDGFGTSDDHFAELLSDLPYGPGKSFRHYVAFDAHRPVSVCTISFSRYGSRLDNMATLSTMRRRGFGTAVLNKALLDAQNAGVKHCFLDSSKEGLNVYLKAGFEILDELLIYEPKSN